MSFGLLQFAADANPIQGGDVAEKQAQTGIKWAFQGFLAQYSAINLTNHLRYIAGYSIQRFLHCFVRYSNLTPTASQNDW